jgi:hypothetical protein
MANGYERIMKIHMQDSDDALDVEIDYRTGTCKESDDGRFFVFTHPEEQSPEDLIGLRFRYNSSISLVHAGDQLTGCPQVGSTVLELSTPLFHRYRKSGPYRVSKILGTINRIENQRN